MRRSSIVFAQGSRRESAGVDVSAGESRRRERERILDDLRIPEDQVTVHEDKLLGKGGFGVVYLADYNGGDAAAKVFKFEHGVGSTPARDGDGDRTTKGELMVPEGFRSRESVPRTSWEKSELTTWVVGLTESNSGRASSKLAGFLRSS